MALMQFAFGQIGEMESSQHPTMIINDFLESEEITPSGSNQQTTMTVPNLFPPGVRVATDTAIYVAFGADPDATDDVGRLLIPAGAIEYFTVQSGWKAAVVLAA
jgi:hypothetical protein